MPVVIADWQFWIGSSQFEFHFIPMKRWWQKRKQFHITIDPRMFPWTNHYRILTIRGDRFVVRRASQLELHTSRWERFLLFTTAHSTAEDYSECRMCKFLFSSLRWHCFRINASMNELNGDQFEFDAEVWSALAGMKIFCSCLMWSKKLIRHLVRILIKPQFEWKINSESYFVPVFLWPDFPWFNYRFISFLYVCWTICSKSTRKSTSSTLARETERLGL
jgi:hypothetical protein